MQRSTLSSRVTAVLGPTNTGKTHLAMERMLGHRTGMIGFPLRLLARENYDRVVRLKGAASVALITGEERIIPLSARWFICTVESMPVDRPVEFLAVDEIQLAADPDRGHIFTDRLLRARGLTETMFLGSETIKPILRRLVPDAEFITRPRLSQLSYVGTKKLARLPRRSALVAFSAAEVYELAEAMRRQRGGCAVVLGALSPRARNAQVELYQSGEVDFMVATDAIGMGLNMDLDHVCFARLSKFDGRMPRRLTPSELAQIAGRAGRHMNNGSFGTTTEAGGLDQDIVEAVEAHRFDPITALSWRNAELDFASVASLTASLDRGPPVRELRRKRDADDYLALQSLTRQSEIAELARGRRAVELLWEVCQIPDFRKTMADAHIRLLSRIYGHLAQRPGRLPTDWVAKQIERLDRQDGDIDQLSSRIAHIRTWTYVSHRPDWLPDAGHWQDKARAIEDRLSDALHEKLTQRFVDRRGAHLVRRLEHADELLAGVTAQGEVVVEGHSVGRLDGFCFRPDGDALGYDAKPLLTVARRTLAGEMTRRLTLLARDAAEQSEALGWAADGRIQWQGAPVARLLAGSSRLAPQVEILPSDILDGDVRDKLKQVLTGWVGAQIRRVLAPLFAEPPQASGVVRGLLFQLREGLGSVPRDRIAGSLQDLSDADRALLHRLGVVLGVEAVFLAPLAKPRPFALRALLDAVHRGLSVPTLPKGPVVPRVEGVPNDWYAAIGYRVLGPRALRLSQVERLAQQARRLARSGRFTVTPDLLAAAGCRADELPAVLTDLGYRMVVGVEGSEFRPRRRATPSARPNVSVDSPFACLKELTR